MVVVTPPNLESPATKATPPQRRIIPPERTQYLREISQCVRNYHKETESQSQIAHQHQALSTTISILNEDKQNSDIIPKQLEEHKKRLWDNLGKENQNVIAHWDETISKYKQEDYIYVVRGKEIRQPMYTESLSHLQIPRIGTPSFRDDGDRLTWESEGEFLVCSPTQLVYSH